MLKSLILKEFSLTSISQKFKKSNLLNTIIELILYIGFIIVEVYLYNMLNKKLISYNDAPLAFLTIILAIISIILIFTMALQSRKTIFNEEDSMIILTKPIRPIDNIISKIIFIYIRNVFLNYFISFPILVCFSLSQGKALYIILCVLYPFIISLFETGIGLLLSLPMQKISQLLRRFFVLQIITSIIIILAFCAIYSYILNVFMVVVKNGDIQTIFTIESINNMKNINNFIIPIRFFTAIFKEQFIQVILMLLISIIALVIGLFAGGKYYIKYIKQERESVSNRTSKPKEMTSVTKALIYKEFKLIFSSNSIFSFAGLLLMEPILTFAIVKAINVIFKSGVFTFISAMFQFIIPVIGMIFVTLFSVIINTSSSFVLSKEGYNGIKICKIIPVSYKKQILIKMIVPFIASFVALLISVIVLIIFKQMTLQTGLLSFVLALILSFLLEMISVSCDLSSPQTEEGQSGRAIVEIAAVLVPIIIVGLILLLSYFGIDFNIAYLVALALIFLTTLLYALVFIKQVNKKFRLLETRN